MHSKLSAHAIYLTKLDHERLTNLVQQEQPADMSDLIEVLKQELKHAHLVDSYAVLPDVITMNSRLKLRATTNDERYFTLVYPSEANEARERVSVLTPMGIAVLGCRLGDQVRWSTPEGPTSYWIEAVLHQPEAAGDWVS
ncbi:nucleoside diphosphate kinase regulator (plasmid) [Hymenobacter sp. NBH84]|uniref:Nucleoside diphosphate kinase regulator n=1 Tax=Hymenobacter citatus TaxID=2763506 RepID=A0ABR7MQ82_9BACT|nr:MULTISPECIES: nucleoside diphosphate kinase regulator [Hymenobacter]MBC6613222.1 nucleoside diphosphate kinase regulator [Hymenobacter citatus]QNE41925.1 nucleoside diphosphate kinase regulator [Hymenobacter sp. NBH84]